jgi:hypothetical protein
MLGLHSAIPDIDSSIQQTPTAFPLQRACAFANLASAYINCSESDQAVMALGQALDIAEAASIDNAIIRIRGVRNRFIPQFTTPLLAEVDDRLHNPSLGGT